MSLSPQPFNPADHTNSAPDEGERGFREWSRHVGDGFGSAGQARPGFRGGVTIDLGHPLVKVAAVAFVGYTLGRMIHRR